MSAIIALGFGITVGAFIFASLYDHKPDRRMIIVPVINRVDDAKLCGNCSAVYDAIKHRCCPKCTSTMGMFVVNYIESEDPKVELVKQHLKGIREGKFRTTPKPDKVIQLDIVREEKVSASDLS